jgi:hypothetical protein
MPLTIGDNLGPYELLAHLGAGEHGRGLESMRYVVGSHYRKDL